MIDTVIRLLLFLLCLLPFLLLALLNAKANLRRQYRDRQFPMPLLALLYCGLLLILLERITPLLVWLVGQIPPLLMSAGTHVSQWFDGALSWLGDGLYNLGTALDALLAQADDAYIGLFAGNALFLLVHIILKRFLITIFYAVFRSGGAVHDFCVEPFYEKDEESGFWCVRIHCGQARTFLRTMYAAALVLSAALVLLSCELYRAGLLAAPFYPVFGVLVLGEVYFFADGLTRRELQERLTGEEDDPSSIRNYVPLRQVLSGLFGDKLGAERTTVDNSLFSARTHDELLHALEESDDPKVEAYGRFMRLKMGSGLKPDHNYLASGLELLQGRSILFNNPFYYDLIPYIFYPMNRVMLRRRKVLIVLGRHDVEQDVAAWYDAGLTAVTNIPGMWTIGVLTSTPQELDVGIVSRSSVHDLALHEANEDFFRQVEFVVVMEPSKLVTTAQIGLNSIVRRCGEEGRRPTFCSMDKNCDGLLDSLSHLLLTSFTEVSATEHHRGISSYMCWEADGDHLQHRLLPNLSRFLGLGTELSFTALKNQVSQTQWYGGEAFPVVDMHWIAKQYYYDLLHYADLPTTQDTMDACFQVSPNLWNARRLPNQFLTVEDESCNMFEMRRVFSTRAENQGFVNILSPEYLLRDYMADNDGIFSADPKAIPCIVADYAPTPRNIILRLCLRMSAGLVSESEIRRELMLADLEHEVLPDSLWDGICRCCRCGGSLRPGREGQTTLVFLRGDKEAVFGPEVLSARKKFSMDTGRMETFYSLSDPAFISLLLGDLQNAGYIAEDERGARQYLGTELRGHVFQKYLPGQFFTFGGKYYEMLRVTSSGQVLVRRAADHISGRPAYRQIRTYRISNLTDSQTMGDRMDISGLHITKQYADISVETPGYWKLSRYSDFASGSTVWVNGVPERRYHAKQLLRIDLPDRDGLLTDKVCGTVALLFNEVFRTLFAENQPYIAAVVPGEAEAPVTYSLQVEDGPQDSRCIYIIEDSQLDLGLLVAVQRNLDRIFSIICDYLDWHTAALEASLNPPPQPEPAPPEPPPQQAEASPGFWKRLKDKIGGFFTRLFRRKPKPQEEPEQAPEEVPVPVPQETPEQETGPVPQPEPEAGPVPTAEQPQEQAEAPDSQEEAEPVAHLSSSASFSFESDQARTESGSPLERKPYHLRYYLLYGGTEVPGQLDVDGTLDFLRALGFGSSGLKQARDGRDMAEHIKSGKLTELAGVRRCDFCGAPLTGTEYEVLSDGRERCMPCSRSAVKTEEEFREIYQTIVENLNVFFGVKISAPVRVEMVNAKKLHRRLGKRFVPTGDFDGRVLGVAIRDKDGYSILVENGAPRIQSTMTIAHELIHIWQYLNWDRKEILRLYGKSRQLEIYEGMAKWGEIQYAYLIGEPEAARREELNTLLRNDAYGSGFRQYVERYPLSTEIQLKGETPFLDKHRPL